MYRNEFEIGRKPPRKIFGKEIQTLSGPGIHGPPNIVSKKVCYLLYDQITDTNLLTAIKPSWKAFFNSFNLSS